LEAKDVEPEPGRVGPGGGVGGRELQRRAVIDIGLFQAAELLERFGAERARTRVVRPPERFRGEPDRLVGVAGVEGVFRSVEQGVVGGDQRALPVTA
jgi:hypothetical protein